jgi:predicted protein tyrosine phosphatase
LGTGHKRPIEDRRPPRSAHQRRRATPQAPKEPIDILVLSAARAAAYEPSRHEVCISIGDPKSEPVLLSAKFADVLRLSFSDIAAPSPLPFHELFATEHARAIIEFVNRWCDVDRIVVHCVAGLSRSPAVALAIADLRGMRTADLERQYPMWNTWVRERLVAAGSAPNPRSRRRRTRSR